MNKYKLEAERQRKARAAARKSMAEDMFIPEQVRGVTASPASSSAGRKLAGVLVSDTAYQLHNLLVSRRDLHSESDAVLVREMNRNLPSAAQVTAETIAAALEELHAAALLAVQEKSTARALNPFTPAYMLEGLC